MDVPAYPAGIELTAVVGGRLRIEIDDAGTKMTVTGRFQTLDRPRKLSFTWYCTTWPPGTPDSLVTVTFDPHGEGGTLMTIHHAQLRDDLIDQHERGWQAIAEQLATALRST